MAPSREDSSKSIGINLALILKNWFEKPGLASKSTMRTEETSTFIPLLPRGTIFLFDKERTGEILERRENHGTKS
jgi:hypothetical protein